MPNITGTQLVVGIKYLTEAASRQADRDVETAMAEAVMHDLTEISAAKFAPKIFRLFRMSELRPEAFRGASVQTPSDSSSAPGANSRFSKSYFVDKLTSWVDVAPQAANELFDKHLERFIQLRGDLFRARSRATHVAAVVRPFIPRYLESWRAANVNGLDFAEIDSTVHRLGAQLVTNESEFKEWAREVFNLFRQCAVVRDNTEWPISRDDPRGSRPVGMIRSQSEKVYANQWDAWIDAYGRELLALDLVAITQAMDQQTLAYRRNTDSHSRVAFTRTQSFKEFGMRIQVVVTATHDSTLRAEWNSWANHPGASQSFQEWADDLILLWGDNANSVQGVITLEPGTAAKTMPVPTATFSKLKDIVSQFILRKAASPNP